MFENWHVAEENTASMIPSPSDFLIYSYGIAAFILGAWTVSDIGIDPAGSKWWEFFIVPPLLFAYSTFALYFFSLIASIPFVVLYLIINYLYALYLYTFTVYSVSFSLAIDTASESTGWIIQVFAFLVLIVGGVVHYVNLLGENSWGD
jgi:hypothetical protein